MTFSRILICLSVLAWSPFVSASQEVCDAGGDAPVMLRVTVPESQRPSFIEFLKSPSQSIANLRYSGGAESDRSISMYFFESREQGEPAIETDSSIAIVARHVKASSEFDFSFKTCNTDKSWKPYLEAVRAKVNEFGGVQVAELPTEDSQKMVGMVFPGATADQNRRLAEVAADLAVVTAWQLAGETANEECRRVDPEGVNARLDQLAAWRVRNEALLTTVNTRVTEVVPLLRPGARGVDPIEQLRNQVRQLMRKELTANPNILREECGKLATPQHELWNSSMVRSVHQSLAALAEWQAENGKRAPAPADLDAWSAAAAMGTGVNIGNTLENTTTWETGWGNPRITKEFIDSLKAMGFKTVRVPVAWDTYAKDGRIAPDKMARVAEVVDWITAAGLYCVVNIHWDGGWIDSSYKEKFPKTYATFSADAENKFVSYWTQIAGHFKNRGPLLVFEGLNEETHFEGAGSMKQAYETLTHVNQLFIDTVRQTGGNNAKRLLIVTGYGTDITKTTHKDFTLPVDSVPDRMMLSVHYYTPWPFAGMTKDESWGKVQHTWGSTADLAELNRLFDAMQEFSKRNDIPVFVGEFGVTDKKEQASRVRWMNAVAEAALSRKMVPVLWDTGGDVSRKPPYGPSVALREVLKKVASGK